MEHLYGRMTKRAAAAGLALMLLGASTVALAHPGGGGHGGGFGGGHGYSGRGGGGWGGHGVGWAGHGGGWGGGYRGGWGWHGGWGAYGYLPYYPYAWGDPFVGPYLDPYPAVGYVVDDQPAYSPPLLAAGAVGALPAVPSYWYYCASSKTYYPYVQECATAWQRVSPTPR